MSYLPMFAEMGALYRGALTFALVVTIFVLSFDEIAACVSKNRKDADE